MAAKTPAPKMRVLSLEDILASDDIKDKTIDIPEWGGSVRIRTFTKDLELRMRMESRDPATGEVDSDHLEMLMVVYGVIEPTLTPDLIPHLRAKNASAIDRILSAITDMNKMGAGAVQEAVKEFQEDTGTESPVPASA